MHVRITVYRVNQAMISYTSPKIVLKELLRVARRPSQWWVDGRQGGWLDQ